ncbi:golgin subfamily A member 1 isoform X1 [Syngnathus typhle]|uniref:golgin subfamily A member 1 isoform X1 n=1 Tax=Syngnathus typhle TaxID=161592 RepID=UPI002A6A5AF4|nr:golgin subfamily A member 1 isoform X1 [Syngnathus typhle]
MFAKLKKKLAEEAATAPRSGVRLPRTISKESITSVGADSGDDFASDGSSSRDDLPAQLLRRNHQIRKLEGKLSDYAEQLRIMQKTKEKLEIALENHQDCTYLSFRSLPTTSIKKLQEQNELHQASRAKMAEGMTLALDKKDQEWMEKLAVVEKEKTALSARLDEMMEQSLTLFQKRDDVDELEGYQQQEIAKVKHMLLRKEEQLSQHERDLQQQEAELHSTKQRLSETQGKLQALQNQLEESSRCTAELEIEREELLLLREETEKKIGDLEGQNQKLQLAIQQVSADMQRSQSMLSFSERSLQDLQTEYNTLKSKQQKAAVTEEDKERMLGHLQKKVNTLERQLQGNLSQDDHLLELLQERSSLEQRLEETRTELLEFRTIHADKVSSFEAQITTLEQQVQESCDRLKSAQQQIEVKEQQTEKLKGEWSANKAFLDQQMCLLQQQSLEKTNRLEETITALQTDICRMEDTMADLERQRDQANVTLKQQIEELEQCKVELEGRQTVSTEIAKALEESRRQREELQTQVEVSTTSLKRSQQELSTVSEKLMLKEKDIQRLHEEVQSQQASFVQLQDKLEQLRAQREQIELDKDSQLAHLREELLSQNQLQDAYQTRISYLEVEVETLTEQLHSPAVCEEDHNGSVTVDDLDHIQKVNKELEQQLSDKNRTIKQLQQRMAELKRTLQKELKLKSEPEEEAKDKIAESVVIKQEMVCAELPPVSSPSLPTANTTVTNTSDLNDLREINFEYLKHVVLKFMSSREAEAYQLIRAVSVLLNFTHEEEDMLKQTLEYKMSWFGSKPSPKGIIRPSVSGSSTHWS